MPLAIPHQDAIAVEVRGSAELVLTQTETSTGQENRIYVCIGNVAELCEVLMGAAREA